jgi:hypothetical protein
MPVHYVIPDQITLLRLAVASRKAYAEARCFHYIVPVKRLRFVSITEALSDTIWFHHGPAVLFGKFHEHTKALLVIERIQSIMMLLCTTKKENSQHNDKEASLSANCPFRMTPLCKVCGAHISPLLLTRTHPHTSVLSIPASTL